MLAAIHPAAKNRTLSVADCISSTSEDNKLCYYLIYKIIRFHNCLNLEETSFVHKLAAGTLDGVTPLCGCLWTLAGGPADQAGLQQLDTLLQLNGQPVEQWKCADLAHAIR